VQGEQLQTIETHIEVTAERVKDGNANLVQASRSSRAARNRCLCIWLILAVAVSVLLIILLT
jgi:syntaxin 7